MRWQLTFWTSMIALLPSPAAAEVVQAVPAGFEITQSVTVDKPVDQVWAMLVAPQKWWDKEHTYSGDSDNLYLDPQATGCFCEKLPGKGSVEHARLVYIQPPAMMRFQGALGPLQAEAVVGTLTYRLDARGSRATRVTLTYIVSGYVRAGADVIAPKVDEVLAVQLLNLKAAAESAAEVKDVGR
ncbi:MAG: SRPBCC family protein [Sphingomonas sp.]|nr:SRPBCC family protein [Sphingomonas sp.]